MRISEDSAKILAVAGEIAETKRTPLIRDTMLFASMICADTVVKDIISENTENIDAVREALDIADFETDMDRDAMKLMADKAFGQLRYDVRRIMSYGADVSRKTKSKGTVCPEHMLFVILSKKVSSHPEIFKALKEGGCDLEGIKSALIEIFSGGEQPDVPDESDEDNGDLPFGAAPGPKKSPMKQKGGKGG
ncbi:MAG: hypothetical protein ILP10_03840, partial [Lachnospiraceae bacterium]|nr:hypothetical protein [Lachnospiraceae bacterium]